MPDPEGLSRGELVELVRDRAAQLKEQDRQIEALRSELERLRRLLTRNRGGRGHARHRLTSNHSHVNGHICWYAGRTND